MQMNTCGPMWLVFKEGESAESVGGFGTGQGCGLGPEKSPGGPGAGSSRGPGYLLVRDHAQCKAT